MSQQKTLLPSRSTPFLGISSSLRKSPSTRDESRRNATFRQANSTMLASHSAPALGASSTLGKIVKKREESHRNEKFQQTQYSDKLNSKNMFADWYDVYRPPKSNKPPIKMRQIDPMRENRSQILGAVSHHLTEVDYGVQTKSKTDTLSAGSLAAHKLRNHDGIGPSSDHPVATKSRGLERKKSERLSSSEHVPKRRPKWIKSNSQVDLSLKRSERATKDTRVDASIKQHHINTVVLKKSAEVPAREGKERKPTIESVESKSIYSSSSLSSSSSSSSEDVIIELTDNWESSSISTFSSSSCTSFDEQSSVEDFHPPVPSKKERTSVPTKPSRLIRYQPMKAARSTVTTVGSFSRPSSSVPKMIAIYLEGDDIDSSSVSSSSGSSFSSSSSFSLPKPMPPKKKEEKNKDTVPRHPVRFRSSVKGKTEAAMAA